MLNVTIVEASEGLLVGSSGSILCQALVKIFDSTSLRTQEQALPDKLLITDALKCLLAISTTAVTSALEGNSILSRMFGSIIIH